MNGNSLGVVLSPGGLAVAERTIPLFVAGQATFAQNDQSWVHLDIQQADKVAGVASDDDKVVF